MNTKLKNLIHQLKGKTYPIDLHYEFYPYAEEAYKAMRDSILNEEFTQIQTANAIQILYKFVCLAFPDNANELFNIEKKCLSFTDLSARSSVVGSLIATYSLTANSPERYIIEGVSKAEVNSIVNEAINNGLLHDVELHANNFIVKGDVTI